MTFGSSDRDHIKPSSWWNKEVLTSSVAPLGGLTSLAATGLLAGQCNAPTRRPCGSSNCASYKVPPAPLPIFFSSLRSVSFISKKTGTLISAGPKLSKVSSSFFFVVYRILGEGASNNFSFSALRRRSNKY
eukprot:Lithocolla_globosa_v1_NODE_1705_length_2390_cov_6.334904.p3 type:complete len:131 gc:universal NODE_1705_length_2390_cov_6.334904:1280-1672(+)